MEKRTCQYCRFAQVLEGHHAPLLICDRCTPCGRRSYRATHPMAGCDQFRPAEPRDPGARGVAPSDPNERLVPVKGGPPARVDAEDYERVGGQHWCARHTPRSCYAFLAGGNVAMHRLIMNAPAGLIVDHIDHDGMNNTKRNLRFCTKGENRRNEGPRCKGASRYKGVSWNRSKSKWRAAITHDWRTYHLGYFDDEIQAARAYDERARELHGRFAYLNFPEPGTVDHVP